jgi:hypothetical protein
MVDCLLRKCVAEDDPELLLQLLEEGLGLLAGPGVLQQVLEYAVAHQELQVVQEVLALGSAELSQAVSGARKGVCGVSGVVIAVGRCLVEVRGLHLSVDIIPMQPTVYAT